MITEWILNVGASFVTWILTLFPKWEPWAWFTNLGGTINSVTSALSGLGAWAAWDTFNVCIAAVGLAFGIFAGIKLVRVAAGHSPIGGGNG